MNPHFKCQATKRWILPSNMSFLLHSLRVSVVAAEVILAKISMVRATIDAWKCRKIRSIKLYIKKIDKHLCTCVTLPTLPSYLCIICMQLYTHIYIYRYLYTHILVSWEYNTLIYTVSFKLDVSTYLLCWWWLLGCFIFPGLVSGSLGISPPFTSQTLFPNTSGNFHP